ncbi:hypothetical protein [Terrabacter sp. BE26]|uniref:hypothetical protein n=1 Tax=Terrabacter sp. BE26 TaxID=2898152 RepID=UPI0035BE7154
MRHAAEDFERLGEQLSASRDANPFEAVTRLAVQRVASARAASVTTLRQEHFVTAGCSDDLGRRADAIQYELGSGPCLDAIVDQTVYQPKDLAADDRWPEFGRRVVAELGIHSMLSFRMNLEAPGVIRKLHDVALDVIDTGIVDVAPHPRS